MYHLGDITKISGYHAPAVDCVIGGSPCQDLSVAGKREGLAGERSGLFMEQIRIIKEMRQHERDIGRSAQHVRPRYMVWENVPGAFSSNKGRDFAAVIEETIRIAEPKAPSVPVPEKGWPSSGCLMGDGWSIAWRVLDAQFWGVPQRRRRIALVADFGGQSAPEILFVRKSVSGDIDQSRAKGKAAARDAGEGADGSVPYTLMIRSGCAVDSKGKAAGKGALIQTDKTATLSTVQDQTLFQPVPYTKGTRPHSAEEAQKWVQADTAGTLNNFDQRGGHVNELVCQPVPSMGFDDYHFEPTGDGTCTLRSGASGGACGVTVMTPQPVYWDGTQTCGTLTANNAGGNQRMPDKENFNCVLQIADEPVVLDRAFFNQGQNALYDPQFYTDGTVPTLVAKGPCAVQTRYIVRRLTPLECERLQGYPDGWTDIGEWVDTKGKNHKEADSPRYKALGNSIAIPPWKWVLKRLCACYERDATMASLFDGIGGFPYIWEQLNGKGSCLWASEIEEFPIAVTKLRFGGD